VFRAAQSIFVSERIKVTREICHLRTYAVSPIKGITSEVPVFKTRPGKDLLEGGGRMGGLPQQLSPFAPSGLSVWGSGSQVWLGIRIQLGSSWVTLGFKASSAKY
jgi:hypothetical protein